MASIKCLANLNRFRLVTFDITDTLIRFSRAPAVQYAKTAAQLGVTDIDQVAMERCFKKEFMAMNRQYPNWGCNIPNFTWQQWWSTLVSNIFYCAKPDIDQHKLKELTNILVRTYRTSDCYRHIEGGRELVDRVRNAGKKVGVISNFDPSLKKVLSEVNLADKFDFILTSYEVGFSKPSKEIYDASLAISKVEAHEALHIGNMYALDYLGARNAGWSSILITPNEIDLNKAQPTHGFRNIKELLHVLDNDVIEW
ncbi:rhythmically expressed gene 2 protein [Stomoxys calcitrans]|uniref:Haloacid dehalogenase-like hydrolase domain-containing protein 3 n=1 Tax=Stomoxys calcitrans TaxID=35570 RepID=A0A1I8NVZ6_STOCA|nr:rhythmically expressed gene 2 protein [Stomoxys calcitrans]